MTEDQQTMVLAAGAEACAVGRALETGEDGINLQEMVDAGQIETIEFEGHEALLEMLIPVRDDNAAELSATGLLEAAHGM